MPVSYFINPEIADDPDLKTLKTITLSYTFYRARVEPVKTSTGPAKPVDENKKVN
jgi:cytochrome c oxidase assembly protein subunit 11